MTILESFRRFLHNRKANVTMIFGLSLIPLIFLVGMGADYTLAVAREDQLDAIADAAALASVTPAMMASNDAASTAAATNTFNSQAPSVSGATYNGTTGLSIVVADTITTRTVTVSYTAASQNAFPGILGSSTIAISGTSQAIGMLAPNINFYLLVDTSPSMALPATTAGITTMENLTPYQCDPSGNSSQCGCAFACHESNPTGEGSTYPGKSCGLCNPSSEDNYALARANSVTLRIDNVRTAVQDLTTTATTIESTNKASYRMALYTFDVAVTTLGTLTSTLSTIDSEASNINVLEVYDNNNLTSSVGNSDEDTLFDSAISSLNSTMPNPGNGTNTSGDTPQEVLFLVTDGEVDQTNGSGALSCSESLSGSRCQEPVNTTECTTIKNRGIRIAVLYTTYQPIVNSSGGTSGVADGWYDSWVSSYQSTIGTQLQSCASPGLYYEVQTGGDISAALIALFQQAVQTAHLSK